MRRLSLSLLLVLAAALVVPFFPRPAPAQGGGEQPDMELTAAQRQEVIDGILKELEKAYVFPEVAKKMDSALRERLKKGEYDSVTSASAFARALTTHLQEVSKDKHLRVSYSHDTIPLPRNEAPSPEELARFQKMMRRANYGFRKVERLDGNVGLLELEVFAPAEFAGETAVAAMNFLANTDALIVDLRRNGGGDPDMIALLCTYLFSEPVHLNDIYWRPDDTTRQFWTLVHVPGKRFLDKEVYVLTSNRTFSGAEEFTYNLKNLKRATIIGETTGGGAHPGGRRRVNDHFAVFVPSGRAINPITKTNWEGTGVKPDVEVPAPEAFKIAYTRALKGLLDKNPDPPAADELKRALENVGK